MLRWLIVLTIVFSHHSFSALNCPVDETDQYPFVVQIRFKNPENNCTGSVFRKRYVLLSAHCLVNKANPETLAEDIQVFSGPSSKTKLSPVKQVSVHPQYMGKDKKNADIAVLELSEDFGHDIGLSFQKIEEGKPVLVGGYGVSRNLNGFSTDGKRRIGANQIGRVTQETICLKKVVVPPSDKPLPKNMPCIPSGQDSGSPMMMDGGIVGVYGTSNQVWHSDGSTEVENCGVNLSNPMIRQFVESFGASSSTRQQKKTQSDTRQHHRR